MHEALKFGISYNRSEVCRQFWKVILKRYLPPQIQQNYWGQKLLQTSIKYFCILLQQEVVQKGSIGESLVGFSWDSGWWMDAGPGQALPRSPPLRRADARAKTHSFSHHKNLSVWQRPFQLPKVPPRFPFAIVPESAQGQTSTDHSHYASHLKWALMFISTFPQQGQEMPFTKRLCYSQTLFYAL